MYSDRKYTELEIRRVSSILATIIPTSNHAVFAKIYISCYIQPTVETAVVGVGIGEDKWPGLLWIPVQLDVKIVLYRRQGSNMVLFIINTKRALSFSSVK